MVKDLFAVAVAVVWAGVYASTGESGLGWDDTSELALAVECHGIPHSPGFPLFVLLGRVVHVLTGVSGARACALAAAMAAASTVGLVARACVRGAGLLGALCAAVCLGASPVVSRYATRGEVYSLHMLLTWLLVLPARSPRAALGKGYVLGLALTTHPTALAFIPLLPFRSIHWVVPGLVAGLSVVGVLPVRAHHQPFLNWGHAHTWHGFLWLVSLREFLPDATSGELVAGGSPWGALRSLAHFLIQAHPPAVLGLLLAGAPLLPRRWRVVGAAGLLCAGSLAVGGGPDLPGYLLPLCPLGVAASFAVATTLGKGRWPLPLLAAASVVHASPPARQPSAEPYMDALARQVRGRILFTDSTTDFFLMLNHSWRTATRPQVVYTPYLHLRWYRDDLDPALVARIPAQADPPFSAVTAAARALGKEPVFTFSTLPPGAMGLLVPEGWVCRVGAYDSSLDAHALGQWRLGPEGDPQGRVFRAVRLAQGGQLLAARGLTARAAWRYAQALTDDPWNGNVWRLLVRCLSELHRCEAGARSMEALVRHRALPPSDLEEMAWSLGMMPVPCPQATQVLMAMVQGRSPPERVLASAARRQLLDGNPRRALDVLAKASPSAPPEILNLRGVALMLTGDYHGALSVLSRAAEAAHGEVRAHIEANIAHCRRLMEARDTARE